MLHIASYSGSRRKFSFSSYYDRHSQAHHMLLHARKSMAVEQQIDRFVQGIQCVTAQKIVVNLADNVAAHACFEAYYNTVASILELSLSLMHTPTNYENRNVNKFASGKQKNMLYKKRNHRD